MTTGHHPYRRYARYPLQRRRRNRLRLNHDAWCWIFVLLLLAAFIALELMRGAPWHG